MSDKDEQKRAIQTGYEATRAALLRVSGLYACGDCWSGILEAG